MAENATRKAEKKEKRQQKKYETERCKLLIDNLKRDAKASQIEFSVSLDKTQRKQLAEHALHCGLRPKIKRSGNLNYLYYLLNSMR